MRSQYQEGSGVQPDQSHREAYAEEMRAQAWDRGGGLRQSGSRLPGRADIISGCTDSAVPVLNADWFEPGQHIVNVGGAGGLLEPAVQDRIDVYFRFGNAPAPQGLPELILPDSYVTYAARPDHDYRFQEQTKNRPGTWHRHPRPCDLFRGNQRRFQPGPHIARPDHLFRKGNLQGNQFHAVGGRVFELAKAAGIGNEVPTEVFLQDIRD